MPKFLGLEPKVWLWALGGLAVVLVLYYVMKSRSGEAGGIPGSPADFGPAGPSSPVSNTMPISDSAGDQYSLQLKQLELESAQEDLRQRKAMGALGEEQTRQQLGIWGAFQNLAFQGAQREQEFQLGYEQEAYRTAQAAQEVVTRSVKGKKKVECPKGQHLVVLADGTPTCQEKGGSGFSFKTVFAGIGDIAEGLFGGAAAAAPGIGYTAANYGASQIGLVPRIGQTKPTYVPARPRQGQGYYTPPIAPTTPYRQEFRGDMGNQWEMV